MDRRDFLKYVISGAAGFFLSDFTSAKTEDSLFLKQYLHRVYELGDDRARRNNQYFIDNICHRKDIYKLLLNQKKAKKDLEEKLEGLGHCPFRYEYSPYPEDIKINSNGHEDVHILNPRQLVRVYLTVDALEKKEFRKQIMDEIEKDLKDPQVEEGYFASERIGLIKVDRGRLSVFPLESVYAKKKRIYTGEGIWVRVEKDYNRRSKFPDGAFDDNLHILSYHIHASQEDSSNSCGPSFDPNFSKGMMHDIKSNKITILICGESHNLVMTKLKGREFNVVYFGGERESNINANITILSLGNWPGG